jgi:hypothetical protein
MQAYLYDNENYYLGSTTLQESPLEPGVYFDQPNSTRIAPPSYGENEIPLWNGSWGIAPDYSGKPYYSKIDKSEKRFERGEAFDINYTDLVPSPESYIVWQNDGWKIDAIKKTEYDKSVCKIKAQSLLIQSDWAELPSVLDQLSNASEWKTYRIEVRKLLIDPVEAPNFPSAPAVVWKKL